MVLLLFVTCILHVIPSYTLCCFSIITKLSIVGNKLDVSIMEYINLDYCVNVY